MLRSILRNLRLLARTRTQTNLIHLVPRAQGSWILQILRTNTRRILLKLLATLEVLEPLHLQPLSLYANARISIVTKYLPSKGADCWSISFARSSALGSICLTGYTEPFPQISEWIHCCSLCSRSCKLKYPCNYARVYSTKLCSMGKEKRMRSCMHICM